MQAVWYLLGVHQRKGVAYDVVSDVSSYIEALCTEIPWQLVSQSLRFLSAAIRSGNYRSIFQSEETISSLVEGVVVPNVGLRG